MTAPSSFANSGIADADEINSDFETPKTAVDTFTRLFDPAVKLEGHGWMSSLGYIPGARRMNARPVGGSTSPPATLLLSKVLEAWLGIATP